MAAPLLLALAMTLNRAQPTRLFSRRDIVVIRTLLPLAALFVSSNTPAALTLILDHNGHLIFTTLRLTLIATYLEFIYFFVSAYWIPGVVLGILIALAAAYGPTIDQLENWTQAAWTRLSTLILNILPTTQIAWGATGVVAAFIFLALGAAVSLRRSPKS